jgi:hypothetical protein
MEVWWPCGPAMGASPRSTWRASASCSPSRDPPSRSVRRAALLFGLRGGYLAVSGPDGVVLHTVASGEPAAVLPLPEAVWRIAMSGNGRVVAVATQHRITLWRLTPGS